MNTIKRNRLNGMLRGAALAAVLAGVGMGAVAVPALAQTVTTTRTVRTYNDYYPYYPVTTYYSSGPVYYDDDWGYAYPPAPAYTYVEPAPPPVGATVGVPGVIGLHFGW
jgi:hypothetical protein